MYTHLNRSVFLTGVLSPPIIVNSLYPIETTQYTVQMNMDINNEPTFMQGGPGKAVGDLSKKVIDGSMTFFPSINENNVLPDAVIELIQSSQDYKSSFTLTTLLNPYNTDITASSPPYIYTTNSLVFDVCVTETFTITAKRDGAVTININVKGQTDVANLAPVSVPNDDTGIYRNLSWQDCAFQRQGSQMENVHEVEITIKKEIDQRYFLMSYCDYDPLNPVAYDRPYSTGVKSVNVSFKFKEEITNVFDLFSYSLGGFLDGMNFSGNFGPINFEIPNALLKVSTEPNPADIIERTTEGFYRMAPNTPDQPNFIFTL